VDLDVTSGHGGRGVVSFRREKYVPAGGPDGGDGGRGGDVIVVADSTDTTLSAYRERRHFSAEHGRPGEGGNRSGRDGEHLILSVPPGTAVSDGDAVIADLVEPGARAVVANGGRGGRGNARFATSTRQAPRIGELGERGEHRRIHLELKLIADIGLVGLPNAGKSTLLAALTGAHPKIAAYPFTTLHPNLGVADHDGRALVIADVPGLIEGAHQGTGLGIDFLRHLERTKVLVHLVDASQGADAARDALQVVDSELRAFSEQLAARPSLLAFNKMDIPAADAAAESLRREFPEAHFISAVNGDGCAALLEAAVHAVDVAKAPATDRSSRGASERHRVYRHTPRRRDAPVVTREGDAYRVSSASVERLVGMTDLDNDEAVMQLQQRFKAVGVDDALAAAGCIEGDTVRIGEHEFIFFDRAPADG
jgi:GTP-binding protein